MMSYDVFVSWSRTGQARIEVPVELVVMNPPWGQQRRSADRPFLEARNLTSKNDTVSTCNTCLSNEETPHKSVPSSEKGVFDRKPSKRAEA